MIIPDYEALGCEIGELVQTKQRAYGNSFGRAGDVMRILYPNGISPQQMDDALTITRILDKLFRIATNRDALGEDPYRDIAGYGLLGAAKRESALDLEDAPMTCIVCGLDTTRSMSVFCGPCADDRADR